MLLNGKNIFAATEETQTNMSTPAQSCKQMVAERGQGQAAEALERPRASAGRVGLEASPEAAALAGTPYVPRARYGAVAGRVAVAPPGRVASTLPWTLPTFPARRAG